MKRRDQIENKGQNKRIISEIICFKYKEFWSLNRDLFKPEMKLFWLVFKE